MNDRTPALSRSRMTPGQRFRHALETASPLPIVGVINPYCAMMAERVGHKAIKASGTGAYSHGLPDLGLLSASQAPHPRSVK